MPVEATFAKTVKITSKLCLAAFFGVFLGSIPLWFSRPTELFYALVNTALLLLVIFAIVCSCSVVLIFRDWLFAKVTTSHNTLESDLEKSL